MSIRPSEETYQKAGSKNESRFLEIVTEILGCGGGRGKSAVIGSAIPASGIQGGSKEGDEEEIHDKHGHKRDRLWTERRSHKCEDCFCRKPFGPGMQRLVLLLDERCLH